MSIVNRLVKDPSGFITTKYVVYKNQVIEFFSTVWCHLVMKAKGISYGNNIKFRGITLFFREPNSLIKLGDNVTFNSSSRFNYRGLNHACILQTSHSGRIIIGNNCGFSGVSIVSSIGVEIGDNVMCGANVTIGDRNDHEDKYPQFPPEKILIKDNVWVGMNCVIMKGVTIGENTIIGANSLVTKNIPANCIAAGSPCKVIKYREKE